MTETQRWQDRSHSALARTFAPAQQLLDRGEGCYVWAEDGTKYLDFLAGIAVNALGHAHPELVAAIGQQAGQLIHISNFYASEPQIALAERLKEITGLGPDASVVFTNSGAEAIEVAIKLARLHGNPLGKQKILALEGAFHGRTNGALALAGKEIYRTPFEPLAPGVVHIPPTLEALEQAMGQDVAAIFLEPIMGEAGVVDLPEGFLQKARELATEHNALLVLDEIQTGIGRTGTWFLYQQEGVVPDVVTSAKGLGAGLPIGAVVAGPAASDLFYPGSHGSTYSGNPLVCASALTVLDIVDREELLENSVQMGQLLRRKVAGLGSPLVEGTSGRGLLIGVALTQPVASEVTAAALEEGLLINAPNPSTVRLAPPLIVAEPEIDDFLVKFEKALERVAEQQSESQLGSEPGSRPGAGSV